jgi:hypothetical protein
MVDCCCTVFDGTGVKVGLVEERDDISSSRGPSIRVATIGSSSMSMSAKSLSTPLDSLRYSLSTLKCDLAPKESLGSSTSKDAITEVGFASNEPAVALMVRITNGGQCCFPEKEKITWPQSFISCQ